MAQVTLTINRTRMRQVLQGVNGPVHLHMANVGRRGAGEARRRVVKVSRRLMRSIGWRMLKIGREWAVRVFATEPYASWIEDGRRYDPRSGKIIYVKVGPRPFLRDALRAIGFARSRRL